MKIKLYHKINLETHDYERKASGIEICCGKCCTECWCKSRGKCKYHNGFKWHNFCVSFNRFFYYHFHLDIHIPIYIRKLEENFSGTPICPFRVERIYSCWDCEYACGDENCSNKERRELLASGRVSETHDNMDDHKCKFFELSEYGNSWDRNTGERIF